MPRGIYQHKPMSEETKKKLSEIQKKIGNTFEEKKHRSDRAKKLGYGKWMKGKHLTKETRRKISKSRMGRKLSEEIRKKLSKSKMGSKNPQWGKGKPHTEEWKQKVRKTWSKKAKKKVYRYQRKHEHTGIKYIEWRTKVYERDHFTCQTCNMVGGCLNAHHIKSWRRFPKLRYRLDNGITLCFNCHKFVHSIRKTAS